ncbi:MAG TPA: Cof-type HAD-IIB family hydrolase [Arachnia sp.]|nr:Cof-type HAD-IIB family hydrolase [Arachnia sp.]HMT87347.1 Cof-type HAD-IIB family hydrolase [Arachnia sp.]
MSSSPRFPLPSDLRLVVTDMDGTLLRPDGTTPEGLWPILAELRERGVLFAAASGRQHGSLTRIFEERADGVVYIADNGCLVVENGEVISTTPLDLSAAERMVHTARDLSRRLGIGLVWSGPRSAYVERGDERTYSGSQQYYAAMELVDDLLDIGEPPLKVAFYGPDGFTEETVATITRAAGSSRTLVSGRRWVDVQNPVADKAVGVRDLQARHGIGPDQTVVFGDFLNDLQLMGTATYSYAMANAHPEVLAAAAYRAPNNAEQGVIQVLNQILEPKK